MASVLRKDGAAPADGDLVLEWTPAASRGRSSSNVDPLTLQLLQSFAIDPDLRAPLTDEVLLSVRRAVWSQFVVSLGLEHHHSLEAERLVFDAA